ncbi:ABC transporter substrate-binding protein [Novosphingobium soli]|uniref:ABC transporter substrate-binding protein n=2 Tax=Novosphingobium soli TaxID=574956 RepID=A0ABV6CYN8_9SPHN
MNQCVDQLVLALLPPERIASVTWLSRDPDGSLMHREAMRVGVNHGLSEEVVRQKPDLVVAGSFTTPATRSLLKRMGYPMIEVDHAESFDDIRRITRQVARAVGEEAKGEARIARMDLQLAHLARDPGPRLRIAAWDGAGFNASDGSLYNAVLEAAGAVNVANRPPATSYGRPDVEVLLATAPALLVKGAGLGRKPGLRDNTERHPLVRRFWDGARTLTIRQAYYQCGTPMVGDAAMALRTELRNAAARVKTPLPFAPARSL